jgi:fructose-1,6-bisphosphatase/inositol monophosphatase family enzyme
LGSASLELSCVANASVEVLIIKGLTPENFAAAYLIIKEAGGILTDERGKELPELDMKKGYNIVASGNKEMHGKIIELLG